MPIPLDELRKQVELEAKENRRKFLKSYLARYKELKKESELLPRFRTGKEAEKENRRRRKAERQIAELIAEVVKAEPSHLSEPWILREVIGWMRRRDCKDFLQAAFMDEVGRDRRTEKKERRLALDFYLINKVDRLRADQGCSIEKACELLGEPDIKKYYKERNTHRQMCEKRDKTRKSMPYPYFGRDIF